MDRLPLSFYARSARVVAQALLGKKLVRRLDNGRILSGMIVETEAYCDADEPDLACHGAKHNGRPTPRTAVMFGQAGHAYVYFTYGMHWMFNVVTGQPGQANAVLVRAAAPLDGVDVMVQNRNGRAHAQLTNGPAKLAQAFAIDKTLNGVSLYQPDSPIWIEPYQKIDPSQIASGARIGLGSTPEPWLSIPWRYWLANHPFVSRR